MPTYPADPQVPKYLRSPGKAPARRLWRGRLELRVRLVIVRQLGEHLVTVVDDQLVILVELVHRTHRSVLFGPVGSVHAGLAVLFRLRVRFLLGFVWLELKVRLGYKKLGFSTHLFKKSLK